MGKTYDLVIIGGGSAGLTAASFAVQLGAQVALLDKDRIGGDCTWTGCVPSKTLLKAAKVAHHMRTARRYGLASAEPEVDLKAVMTHVRDVIDEIYQEETPEALRADGIDVFMGAARFINTHTLAVGQDLEFTCQDEECELYLQPETGLVTRNILIATGAHPFIPPIDGLDQVDYLTYETIWELDRLPRHLLIAGAGPVGCEMAQAFRRLGSEVTLLSSRDRILPQDDEDASRVLAQTFEAEGISLHYNARAERAWQDEMGIHLTAGEIEVVGDTLLVAAGRRPNVSGLDLEKADVAYSLAGIRVDDALRTSQKHIYAAGDCLGGHQFTHYAAWQAVMALRNALLPGSTRGVTDRVPWTTFTDPEVAHVGLTEAQARERFGDEVVTCEWPMSQVDRARTEGDTAGFMKLIHKKNGTLLGATVVAERAGETIHEWIVALNHDIKVGDLASTIHVYPTYSTTSMQAAAGVRVSQLLSGMSGRIVRGLARLIR